MNKNSVPKALKPAQPARRGRTVGASIIKGLKEAIAWTEGKDVGARVTQIEVPRVDVREARLKMRLSQAQFAAKFGLPPATLKNWEQGRAYPDAPARVLLAVIASHPDVVAEVLRQRSR